MGKREKDAPGGDASQATFLQMVVNQVEPEFMTQLVRSSPQMVIAMLEATDPEVLAEVVNKNPAVFSGFFSTMPRGVMRTLLVEKPDILFDLLRNLDPDIVLDMMGLED
jgi:hypothetical protein